MFNIITTSQRALPVRPQTSFKMPLMSQIMPNMFKLKSTTKLNKPTEREETCTWSTSHPTKLTSLSQLLMKPTSDGRLTSANTKSITPIMELIVIFNLHKKLSLWRKPPPNLRTAILSSKKLTKVKTKSQSSESKVTKHSKLLLRRPSPT